MQTSYFKTSKALLEYLELPTPPESHDDEQAFVTRVPLGFAKLMEKGNPNDPLLLQVLASTRENALVPGYTAHPLEESAYNPVPGLIHKYRSRVLLTVTGSCAIHCRYCFRRHFPYQDNNPGLKGWQKAFDYIQNDDCIDEVIFSGGDPLMAKNGHLAVLIEGLAAIPHIKTIRMHSRIPIVEPERIDAHFCNLFDHERFCVVMVMHANHANELSREVAEACARMRASGMQLLNQSVLLKNINDSAETLTTLSRKLWSLGVLPYYLHELDKVQGAAHFEVASTQAKQLMAKLSEALPGYLVPKFVVEIPGVPNKTIRT